MENQLNNSERSHGAWSGPASNEERRALRRAKQAECQRLRRARIKAGTHKPRLEIFRAGRSRVTISEEERNRRLDENEGALREQIKDLGYGALLGAIFDRGEMGLDDRISAVMLISETWLDKAGDTVQADVVERSYNKFLKHVGASPEYTGDLFAGRLDAFPHQSGTRGNVNYRSRTEVR